VAVAETTRFVEEVARTECTAGAEETSSRAAPAPTVSTALEALTRSTDREATMSPVAVPVSIGSSVTTATALFHREEILVATVCSATTGRTSSRARQVTTYSMAETGAIRTTAAAEPIRA
jgi:hypothetical protein